MTFRIFFYRKMGGGYPPYQPPLFPPLRTQTTELKGMVSRFSACASYDARQINSIVYGPIGSEYVIARKVCVIVCRCKFYTVSWLSLTRLQLPVACLKGLSWDRSLFCHMQTIHSTPRTNSISTSLLMIQVSSMPIKTLNRLKPL